MVTWQHEKKKNVYMWTYICTYTCMYTNAYIYINNKYKCFLKLVLNKLKLVLWKLGLSFFKKQVFLVLHETSLYLTPQVLPNGNSVDLINPGLMSWGQFSIASFWKVCWDSGPYRTFLQLMLERIWIEKGTHSQQYINNFPDGSDGKESAYQCRTCGFSLWVGKIPWRKK